MIFNLPTLRAGDGTSVIECICCLGLFLLLASAVSYPLRRIREGVVLRDSAYELQHILVSLAEAAMAQERDIFVHFDRELGRVFEGNAQSTPDHAGQKRLIFGLPQGLRVESASFGHLGNPDVLLLGAEGVLSPGSVVLTDQSGNTCELIVGLRGSQRTNCSPSKAS